MGKAEDAPPPDRHLAPGPGCERLEFETACDLVGPEWSPLVKTLSCLAQRVTMLKSALVATEITKRHSEHFLCSKPLMQGRERSFFRSGKWPKVPLLGRSG